jgi:hypothetical protein
MAYVIADPQMMTSAASDLAAIGSNVDAAHKVAAARTTSVIPAAADEVSASIAHLFSQHATDYQALAGQAAAFHDQFVGRLTASAAAYAHTEAPNTALLRPATPAANIIQDTLSAWWADFSPIWNVVGVVVVIPLALLALAIDFIYFRLTGVPLFTINLNFFGPFPFLGGAL